ncbi:MAG: cytochrome P450 [Chitinophagales bacterium]|nr:MAG: cytochrome P450 [Chitinophagales bacterium]
MDTRKAYPPVYKARKFLEPLTDTVNFLAYSPERYPEAFRFRVLGREVYVLNHPEYVQYVLQEKYRNYRKGEAYETLSILLGNGLINSEGEFWRRQRRLAQPAFHAESLKRVSKYVVEVTGKHIDAWKKLEGKTINFTKEMAAVAIEVVARALFSSDISPADINTVWHSVNYLNHTAIRMIRNPLAPPFWMPLPGYIKGRKFIATLDRIVYDIIRKRKSARSGGPPDLLQLLLEVRDAETGERMSEQQLRDEVMTIFLAGHETTVNALSWTWYLLKQHADEEDALRKESRQLGLELTFDHVPCLRKGSEVIFEAMRLYPPVYAIGRRPVAEGQIKGFAVFPHSRILINIIGLHHHPCFWEKPWTFNPVHFRDYDMKRDYRFLYIPFGAGPRTCIGNHFALMEMHLINALLSQRVEMELVSRQVEAVPQITLKPKGGIIMRINKVY